MHKWKRIVFIIVFMGVLIIPTLSYPFVQKFIDSENYENRELAAKPVIAETSLTEYPSLYENYFNDHLPYKNQLQFINKAMDIFLFHSLNSDQVILGKDGWLFYKNGDCIQDYLGTRVYSDAELEEIVTNLQAANDWFAKRNMQMIVNIVPNKDEVYSQYMPEDYIVVNETSMSQQAVEYVKEKTDIPVFYELDNLKKASESVQTYCKYDTHWNFVGAYYGTISVLKSAGITMQECTNNDIVPWSQDVFPVARQQCGTTYDLSMMIGMPNFFDIKRDPKFMINYRPDVHFQFESLEEYSDIDTMRYVSDAKDSRHAMMICDSFGNLNMPYVAKEFANSSCIHYNHYRKGFLTEENPDVVIFQFVERQAMRFDQQILSIIGIEESEG